jgi:hypothetical protein
MLFWNCTKNATQKMRAINLQAQRKNNKIGRNSDDECAQGLRGHDQGGVHWLFPVAVSRKYLFVVVW